jgi:hypothetical protein
MKHKAFVLAVLFCCATATWVRAQDGGPGDFGPTDEHKISAKGLNQKVLIIYVQANDYRILPSELAALNTTEVQEIVDFKKWFAETSWDQLTLDVTEQKSSGGNWYLLPGRYLDYSRSAGLRSMEFRNAAQASTSNPTPPVSLSASVVTPGAGDPASDFKTNEEGNYWYAVSGFKNGVESQLTRTPSAINVTAGKIVQLTITRAATDDVDYYLVYRSYKNAADALQNYYRLGDVDETGATNTFVDDGQGLDNLSSHYNLLTAAMTAADADVADFEAYNAIITIIFSTFLRGQAAGAQTFIINSQEFKIQTINQSSATDYGRFCHEIGHWIGLPDQYDPVTAGPRGYWTTMDGANSSQYAAWEKDHILTYILAPGNVQELLRPGPGSPDYNNTFQILPTALKDTYATPLTTVKIKSSESVHYYLEGRNKFADKVSDVGANKYVVIMEAVDAWPPGIYPERTLNSQKILNAGDAVYKPDPITEITYTGTQAGPPETYTVQVKIKAEEQSDPKITPWSAPPWESVDIWVDSSREGGGWDNPATAAPKAGNGEAAWVDHVNRVFAKISNVGGAEAKDVLVHFRVNTPGGIGDAGTYVDLTDPAKVTIPAGGWANVYAEWTPTVGSHTCIQVEINHIPGEKDIYNNFAQENVTHFYSGSESPWKEVTFPVRMANPFDEPKTAYLEISGLQTGWKAHFDKRWVELAPYEVKIINVTITPPPDAQPCTKVELNVYGLIQIDDFIQTYGGLSPIIHLANPIKFQRLSLMPVEKQDPKFRGQYDVQGLTVPVIANREIAVILRKPDGTDQVVFATTDGTGFFRKRFTADTPGEWRYQLYYAGDDCHAPTETQPTEFTVPGAVVPPPNLSWLSLHGGISIPMAAAANSHSTGLHFYLDAGYRINPRLSFYAMAGLCRLPSKGAGSALQIVNANLNLRLIVWSQSRLETFLNAGPGLYRPGSGAAQAGGNAGAGLEYGLTPRLSLELCGNYHFLNDAAKTRFFNISGGLLIKL